jgi:hypothetical protein
MLRTGFGSGRLQNYSVILKGENRIKKAGAGRRLTQVKAATAATPSICYGGRSDGKPSG